MPDTDHLYAEMTRSERWLVDGDARRLESISGGGWSEARLKRGALSFVASDRFEGALRHVEEELRSRLDPPGAAMLDEICAGGARLDVRIVAKSRYVARGTATDIVDRTAITLATDRASVVTEPRSLAKDLATLLRSSPPQVTDEPFDSRDYPIVWTEGSGAVLLHEAIGHPAERSAPPVDWPPWLEVFDDPAADGFGTMRLDDSGRPVARRSLTREEPSALRRESFRDVPLPRMTNLVVAASAEAPVPDPRIEIALLAGGSYDPLTDVALLFVAAAAIIDGTMRRPLPHFNVRVPRRALAGRLLGTAGAAKVYPGVICFDEGQRIPVGSFAPDLVTAPFDEP